MNAIKNFKSLVIAGASFFAALSFSVAAHAQALGPEIVKLNPPQPVENDGKIEVLEFFAYGCIHCANIEPKLEAWIKRQPADVKVKRVPAGRGWELRGIDNPPLYYTLEAMGLIDKLQQKVFNAANIENVILGNTATLNKWLEKNGVDTKAYENVQKSFSVQNKIARAYKMTADYKPSGTPTVVVNGRHSVQLRGSEEALFAAVDQLIQEARAANKASGAATAAATPAAKSEAAPAAKAAPAKKKPVTQKPAPVAQ